MLKSAFVPLQCTLGSRTAMAERALHAGVPEAGGLRQVLQRAVGVPDPQIAAARGRRHRAARWLPKTDPIVVKSAGTGTCVTNSTGFGSRTGPLCARPDIGDRRPMASTRHTYGTIQRNAHIVTRLGEG